MVREREKLLYHDYLISINNNSEILPLCMRVSKFKCVKIIFKIEFSLRECKTMRERYFL
jgi:hypothetical protein